MNRRCESLHLCRVICGVTAAASYPGSLALAQPCVPFWGADESGVPSTAHRLVVFDDGHGPHLYVGGESFVSYWPPSYQPVPLFKWNGAAWEPQNTGFSGQCYSLLVLDDGVGPPFLFMAGFRSGGVGYWAGMLRGGVWGDPPPGMYVSTQSGAAEPRFAYTDTNGPVIIGYVTVSVGHLAVARWTNGAWQVLGGPANSNSLTGVAALDSGGGPKVCVCGSISSLGGTSVDRVARWNGSAWEALGTPPGVFHPRALTVYDDGAGPRLYMGGDGQPPSSTAPTPPLVRWTGSQWEEVGGGLSIQTNTPLQVNALHVFDDGTGPALYAAGSFRLAGGLPVRNIARWDGLAWRGLGDGIGFRVESFATFEDRRGHSLFAGGSFTAAGAGQAPNIAQWVGCPNCYANCDTSTQAPALNILDFLCFLNRFAARDPYANCTVDATIDVSDFACFLNKFAAGCP